MVNQFHNIYLLLYDICYENYVGLTKNPRWLLMRNLARFNVGRALIEFLSKISTKVSELSVVSESNTLFPDINVDSVVTSLKKEGLYLGINLTEEIVKEIVWFAYSQPCYGYRQPKLGFYYHQKQLAESYYNQKLALAGYFNTSSLCTAINKLQNDPKLLAIAAKYLEHKPVHQGNLLWWSFTGDITDKERRQSFQMFHYDIDDYRFLKFFFYLTDVDEFNGPHVCIRGSHKHKKLSHLLLPKRETDAEIFNSYGRDSLISICGQAGFGFAEDTFCFHKGTTPVNKDRLMLQVEFGTTDYGMQHDIRKTSLLQLMGQPDSI